MEQFQRFPLTKQEFRAYLRKQHPERRFQKLDPCACACPLAMALTEAPTFLTRVAVDGRAIRWEYVGGSIRSRLPRWGQRFVEAVDAEGGHGDMSVSALVALTILEDL